ncbi:hypothetical protein ACFLUC_03535, partial [Chloroflexota bacterium]
LIALPILLFIGREFVFGRLIGYMRVVDAADMAILTPIYIFLMLYLANYMSNAGAPKSLLVTFLVFAFVFIFGQAMHATGNSINTFATEVRDYKPILPKDLYALIFFLDERLSHLVLFAAVTGLVGCWFVFDQLAIADPLIPRITVLIVLIGVIYGVTQAYAIIEARMVWIVFPMVLTLMGMWVWFWRKSNLPFRNFLTHRPFTTFVAIMSFTCIAAMILYGFYFGGFPQPSEMI